MFQRQRVALHLLRHCHRPLDRTKFVKLMFQLRQHEALRDAQSFYDFVPYTYGPFSFALNSERPERRLVEVPERPAAGLAVYTTGYEGRSIDGFLNGLLKDGIRTLIDTRAVPVSRKYGFAKSALSRICGLLEIEYVHLPSLGIPSNDRKLLGTEITHAQLFRTYSQNLANHAPEALDVAAECLTRAPSALMCVEQDPARCHRTPLAHHLTTMTGLEVTHQ